MLTIHGVPVSVHTRKIIVAAILKGLDYRVEPVIPFTPPENWASVSPTGLIPVIEDGDFVLSDSTAIALYLERKGGAALLPAEAQAYARAIWFDAYAGGTMFRHLVHGLFFNKVVRPGILGEPGDQSAIDAIVKDTLPKVFGYLESQVGDGWLVGDALSLADIAVGSNLVNLRYLGFEVDTAAYPKLAAYADRIVDLPAFRTALAAEAPFAAQLGLQTGFLRTAEPA